MTEKFTVDENRLKAVEDNYKSVKSRVEEAALKAGRNPADVRLMAVTKTVESVYINKVLDLGADLIGENRVQEYLGKKDELHLDNVEKHLIGHLQTNKVKQIVGEVDMIESVDSVKLATEINRVSKNKGLVTNILVEVNVGKEDSKSGIYIEQLEELLNEIALMSNIKVKGLMTIPPICDSEKEVSQYFSTMYQSFIDIRDKKIDNIDMEILSMGMSGDFEAAIANGSNIVRVGSSIFGARKYF
ncbi:MAG TPA: YggS family pyridoxal phosphate-dependent enzyme [Candidatus Eubacterium faecigallinarum]|nr:YggS family pyridoxal phosphate-dependent enzyme [Candidatus Eubacterium faecigallinarum]